MEVAEVMALHGSELEKAYLGSILDGGMYLGLFPEQLTILGSHQAQPLTELFTSGHGRFAVIDFSAGLWVLIQPIHEITYSQCKKRGPVHKKGPK